MHSASHPTGHTFPINVMGSKYCFLVLVTQTGSDQPVLELPAVNKEAAAVPVVLPFKD